MGPLDLLQKEVAFETSEASLTDCNINMAKKETQCHPTGSTATRKKKTTQAAASGTDRFQQRAKKPDMWQRQRTHDGMKRHEGTKFSIITRDPNPTCPHIFAACTLGSSLHAISDNFCGKTTRTCTTRSVSFSQAAHLQ